MGPTSEDYSKLFKAFQGFSRLLIREGTMKHPEKVKNQDEKVWPVGD